MKTHAPAVTVQDWCLPSATGIGLVQARTYLPDGPPALVLQVIHGIAEHMGRYDAFARDLAAQGIAVVCSDLPGHGRSAPTSKHLGFAAERNGWRLVLADQYAISVEMMARMPHVPYFLYGHSMGCMLASAFTAENGDRLSGAILSAPTGPRPELPFAWLLTRLSVWRNGPFYRDPFLDGVMRRGMLARIPNPASKNDWLSDDPEVVQAYDADPLCGFCFTSAGFRDLNDLLMSIQGRRWARRVPRDLSILIVAGREDPVGHFGKGPAAVRRQLEDTGHRDVKLILYDGVRHEPHQGKGRQAVIADIAAFLLEKAPYGGQS